MNGKPPPPPECGLLPSSSPSSLAPPPLINDTLVTSPSVSVPPPTPAHSLASFFLHPASLAASLAGYPPHPWTISWMNAAAGYGFVNAASSVAAAMDLSTVHQHRNSLSSIADLRLKAKRHAEELVNVSLTASNNNNQDDNDDQASPL